MVWVCVCVCASYFAAYDGDEFSIFHEARMKRKLIQMLSKIITYYASITNWQTVTTFNARRKIVFLLSDKVRVFSSFGLNFTPCG